MFKTTKSLKVKINLQQTTHHSKHKNQLRSGTMMKINIKQKEEVIWESVEMCVYNSKCWEIKKEIMWAQNEWLFKSSKFKLLKKMQDQKETN